MNNPTSYRGYAARCIEMANDAFNIERQCSLFEMAKVWLQLAEDAEHTERALAIRARWQGHGIEKPH